MKGGLYLVVIGREVTTAAAAKKLPFFFLEKSSSQLQQILLQSFDFVMDRHFHPNPNPNPHFQQNLYLPFVPAPIPRNPSEIDAMLTNLQARINWHEEEIFKNASQIHRHGHELTKIWSYLADITGRNMHAWNQNQQA